MHGVRFIHEFPCFLLSEETKLAAAKIIFSCCQDHICL
ncbi:hypothetical protein DU19_0511 [Chlamydia muridarum]|nr:hypothetical protein DU17_0513 [Chlamydia muridarum]KDU81473.1 hypothetical protein DU18_0513 [Chlamydia muridarum]KDU82504.1 hypothetical protein DU19_0511 [Chlamydia muridarum]KDU83425.1 hypothetical protein DU20_0511 [Chlamydia muridarum]KDU84108.1 hypothetical protein DU21_0513 [Chlamydia muridarum]